MEQNGCACGERVEKKINYEGDVAYLAAQGFDGVKLDGCGHQRNMTLCKLVASEHQVRFCPPRPSRSPRPPPRTHLTSFLTTPVHTTPMHTPAHTHTCEDAQLMKATGKNYTIENCHWGDCTHSDDSSCPTTEWCPFNWYRSSGDINSGSMSWFHNLQTTIRFQSWDAPVSRPGCWVSCLSASRWRFFV